MGAKRTIELVYPVGGLVRRFDYQRQHPFSSPDCLNVRPFDVQEGRQRGGSRPMLEKAFADQLGSGNPVRMMNTVLSSPAETARNFADEFNDSSIDSSKWEAGNQWFTNRPREISTFIGETAGNPEGQEQGLVAILADPVDGTKPYTVTASGFGTLGTDDGHTYRLYGGLDESSPNGALNCVYAEYFAEKTSTSPTTYRHTISIYQVINGVLSSPSGTFVSNSSAPAGVTLTFNIDGDTATISLSGPFSKSHSKTISALVGHRVAFGMEHATSSSTLAQMTRFELSYHEAVSIPANMLVASAGGGLSYTNGAGALTAVGGNLTLASDRLLHAADLLGYLYIADNGAVKIRGTAGEADQGVVSAGGVLDVLGFNAWDTLGIDTDDDVCEVTSPTSTLVAGVYAISTVHASNGLTLTGAASVSGGNCTFRVLRGAKRFFASNPTLSLWLASSGLVPAGCPIITVFRERIITAGDPDNPNVVRASRQSNPLDFDYGASDTDVQRAWFYIAKDPVTAAFAGTNDYLIIACANSLWQMNGDYTQGANINRLSDVVGVIAKGAWCAGPESQMLLLTRKGLYGLPPGGNAFPQPISEAALPNELRDINPATHTVQMQYDAFHNGVDIFITPNASAPTTHWWYDWPTKSFWPMELPSNQEPTATAVYKDLGAGVSDVLLGGRDGYIRRFSDEASDDDGVTMNSHVMFGPFRPGGQLMQGGVVGIVGTLDQQSADVTWGLHVGNTGEEVVDSDPAATGTFKAGVSRMHRPRRRGCAAAIKLSSTGRWMFENMVVEIEQAGKQRV